MVNVNLFFGFLIWLCIAAVLSLNDTVVNLNQTSDLEATEELIKRYTADENVKLPGLTVEEFASFVKSATGRSDLQMKDVIEDCQVSNNCTTRRAECPGISEVFQKFAQDNQLNAQGLLQALPVIFYTLTSANCSRTAEEDESNNPKHHKPSSGEAWGYSIAFTSIVIIISNIGGCLGPIMDKKYFKRILQFLVAMGAGSLASTGLLVLLPEAFDLMAAEELSGYIWKSTAAIFSIYVFFCSERILKVCLTKRKKMERILSITVDEPSKTDLDSQSLTGVGNRKEEEAHGHSHLPSEFESAERRTLAWMVMAGDIIHNFVDGLSIGAAFTEDVALGISISLAVVCEELPHELADIAILLHSGMSMKKSLLINFVSACMIYLGVILGVLLGSIIGDANKWIFALAGGLFLYVPLVDMLPDMSSQLDKLVATSNKYEAKIIAMLHAFGLVTGACIILLVVNLSSYIVVE